MCLELLYVGGFGNGLDNCKVLLHLAAFKVY